jgi:hypothetical protein
MNDRLAYFDSSLSLTAVDFNDLVVDLCQFCWRFYYLRDAYIRLYHRDVRFSCLY